MSGWAGVGVGAAVRARVRVRVRVRARAEVRVRVRVRVSRGQMCSCLPTVPRWPQHAGPPTPVPWLPS